MRGTVLRTPSESARGTRQGFHSACAPQKQPLQARADAQQKLALETSTDSRWKRESTTVFSTSRPPYALPLIVTRVSSCPGADSAHSSHMSCLYANPKRNLKRTCTPRPETAHSGRDRDTSQLQGSRAPPERDSFLCIFPQKGDDSTATFSPANAHDVLSSFIRSRTGELQQATVTPYHHSTCLRTTPCGLDRTTSPRRFSMHFQTHLRSFTKAGKKMTRLRLFQPVVQAVCPNFTDPLISPLTGLLAEHPATNTSFNRLQWSFFIRPTHSSGLS